MLKLDIPPLNAKDQARLQAQQDKVNAQADYAAQVAYAKDSWNDKPRALFDRLRTQLEAPLSGNSRCAYCEDSLADEIEHMRPKQLFPSKPTSGTTMCWPAERVMARINAINSPCFCPMGSCTNCTARVAVR